VSGGGENNIVIFPPRPRKDKFLTTARRKDYAK